MNAPDPIATTQTESVDATKALGYRLGAAARAGDVFALVGRLGAGKTHLVKGIAMGLGVGNDRTVNSPTFIIVNEYAGRVPIHHLDAYRLNAATELLDLGFEDMCAGNAVVIVEWADRVPAALPADTAWITITVAGETARRFELTGAGEPARRLSASLSTNP
jgi:tRNA threonylcarbamoyladenosine biosynthesis protein TsaE